MLLVESLIAAVKGVCAGLPDRRRGKNCHYPMADFGMAAFSVFFMQSPSFLAHQRQLLKGQGRSNCNTLFGLAEIPTENQVRKMLDPVDAAAFDALFDTALHNLEARGGLADFKRLGNHVLIALDGTEYHRSSKVFCDRCSHVTRASKTEYFHTMVCAALVAPGHNRVVPLAPTFVEPQDGVEKQDCESRACRRWLQAHAAKPTPQALPISIPSTSATISTPASRSARPCSKPAVTFSSSASRTRTRP